jgi:hypothetical protein
METQKVTGFTKIQPIGSQSRAAVAPEVKQKPQPLKITACFDLWWRCRDLKGDFNRLILLGVDFGKCRYFASFCTLYATIFQDLQSAKKLLTCVIKAPIHIRYQLIPNRVAMNRPSHKELTGKLRQAKDLVSRNAILLLNQFAIAGDAIELGYIVKDIQDVLCKILSEIDPGHYAGTSPPPRSYEKQIFGIELYAFRWFSKRFGCKTYFKFAIQQDRLWVASLHEHRIK